MRRLFIIIAAVVVLLTGCWNYSVPNQQTKPDMTEHTAESVPSDAVGGQSTEQYGYPSGQIQTSMVFMWDTLYVKEEVTALEKLPQNAVLVGAVSSVNHYHEPTENWSAAQMEVGAKIFAVAGDTLRVYWYCESEDVYCSMIRADQITKWW